uniref:uncharacterized protein LOC109974527 n=1 Tax=Monopterus albus TaxID=43700 RepID=UPI0009B452FF|nr:uncharacterized protein LOC109974527 [Monopterus albus]
MLLIPKRFLTRSLVYVLFSCLSSLAQTQAVPHQIPVTVANVSDDVTLTCPVYGDRAGVFYWYKVKCGYMVQIVAEGTFAKVTLKNQFDNSRFTVIRMGTQYHLNITNVQKEDEATYFCQSGSAYAMHFTEGTYLAVNDHNNQQKSVYVKQSPETVSTQLGGSVTLQCSLLSKSQENRVRCPGEHNVHWFRAGSGYSHPSVLYTHNDSSDEQEQRSCVYSLSKTVQDSDNGTYYCAVVTCGQILFGEGTKVEIRTNMWSPKIIFFLALSLIVTVFICTIKCDCSKASVAQQKNSSGQENQQRDEDTWVYSVVVFTVMKTDSYARKDAKAAEKVKIYTTVKTFGLD